MDYKNYSKDIQIFMKGIEDTLIKRHGSVDPSWDLNLKLLADTIRIYNDCMDSIEEHGIYNEKKELKNPLLSTVKECIATITKITASLGADPWHSTKMKLDDTESTEDFIDKLTD